MKKVLKISALIIVLILGVLVLTGCGKEEANVKNIKDEVITAENYEELSKRIENEMGNDEELYYFSYSMMYYMMKDGMSSALTGGNSNDDSAMFVNIYGKTIKQLITEGKQLMKDNGVTIEQFKQNLQNLNNQ